MGAGANVGGFGAGFGRGLAKALLLNRERSDQKTREEQARKDRLFAALLPTMLENVEDPSDLEPFLAQQFPEQFGTKPGKKGGSPFEKLRTFLGPLIGMREPSVISDDPNRGGITGNLPRPGTSPMPSPGPAPRPSASAAVTAQPLPQPIGSPAVAAAMGVDDPTAATAASTPNIASFDFAGTQTTAPTGMTRAPRKTLMGVPIMSPSEKLDRDIDLRKTMVERARSVILPALKAVDPTATIDDALAILTTGRMAADRTSATPFQQVKGVLPDGTETFAVFDQAKGAYIDQISRQPIPGFRPINDATAASFGVDREAIARALYGKGYGQLDQAQQQAVITEEQKMLQAESKARAIGGGQGRFESPIDVSTAQDTGTQVGATSADYAGQTVAPLDTAAQRRDLGVLRQELGKLLQPATTVDGVTTPGLLDVLPSKNELAGIAPGAVLAARRRMNTYREAAARLQSVVDGMATTLARVKAGQRGAQTERDAERAYNAVVQLQTGLSDPFGGDTRESAAARIQETLESLDRVIAGLPSAPAPRPNPQGGAAGAAGGAAPRGTGTGARGQQAPAGGGTGLFMDAQGNLVDSSGRVVVPAQ